MIGKPDIKDLSLGQLQEWLAQQGIAAYRGGQILRWINGRQADTFDTDDGSKYGRSGKTGEPL